jgi:hypothetical protein
VGHSTASDDSKNTPTSDKSEASEVGHSTASDESKNTSASENEVGDTKPLSLIKLKIKPLHLRIKSFL